jgi:hypothetical protein
VPLDTRGGATLRLMPGRWILAVGTETGWAAQDLTVAAGAAEVTLAMQPHALARFELRGDDGQPVAGARIVARGTTTRGTTLVESVIAGLRTRSSERWSTLATDADGRVVVPFVPVEGSTVRIALMWPGGSTVDLTLEPTTDWKVVRPR